MKHGGTKRIETERLILRPFVLSDDEAMFRNWAGDSEVTRYLTWPTHDNVEVTRRVLAFWVEETKKPEFYQWAVELRELGEPIGSLSAVRFNEKYAWAELGYCIGKAWWGRGLMAEAVRAVIEYLIREVGFQQVLAVHDRNNPNSGKVMRKAGMKRQGVLRRSGSNNSDPCCDLVQYSILADELDAPSPAFRPLARSRQALTREESVAILQRQKRGVLSLVGDEGWPYGVPLNHWYCPEDGKLYFHGGMHGHRIDAMRAEPRASYCVLDDGTQDESDWSLWFQSVIVFGRLEIVEDGERAMEIARKLSLHFTDDVEYIDWEIRNAGARTLCFALSPEHISGKRVHEK